MGLRNSTIATSSEAKYSDNNFGEDIFKNLGLIFIALLVLILLIAILYVMRGF